MVAGLNYNAFRVIGLRGHAPAQRHLVDLLCGLHELYSFGGLAQCHWQNAGGQRVERASVSGFFGIEHPPHGGNGPG